MKKEKKTKADDALVRVNFVFRRSSYHLEMDFL
jgi:hypothetical protein